MPNDLVTSLAEGEPEIVDEAILDDMPPEDDSEQSGAGQEGATKEETQEPATDQEPAKADDQTQETVDWKARAEKNERIARQYQSQYDRLQAQVQPHASRLAEMIRADQEKAKTLATDRDALLREFANNPHDVIRTLVSAEMQAARTYEQQSQIQYEAQAALVDLVAYAGERGVDGDNLTLLLQPYNNFANLHPQQALALAKVVVDKATAGAVDQTRVQAALTEADKQSKQKLVKKTPAGAAGGAVQGREKSAQDEAWDRIKNSGPRNPLRSLH